MEQWLLNNLLAFGLAFLLTGILIPQILVIAFRKNLFDGHDTRKLHSGKVPRLGGVAFVPAIIFSVLATLGWSMHVDGIQMMDVLSDTIVPLLFLICTLMLLFLVGIADDLIGVRYGAKFLFQMLAALLMVVSGVWLQNLHGLLGLQSIPECLGWIATIVAVVCVVNSINLIDGIDGLASGLAAIALCFYGVIFYCVGSYVYSMVAFGAFGSLIPFIYYNIFGKSRRRNKIFMGDTGSLTIGMLLVFLSINITSCGFEGDVLGRINPMIVAVAPLLIPLLDVGRVFWRRVRHKRNPFMPDRSHIHHKLLILGLNSSAALGVILTAAFLTLAANVVLSMWIDVNLLLLADIAIWILANLGLTRCIRRRERKMGKRIYE